MRLLAALLCICAGPALGENTDWEAVNQDLRARAPQALKALPLGELCIGIGNAVRQDQLPNGYDGPDAAPLALAEARRRGLRIDVAATKAGGIRIGNSECQLLASLGRPRDSNRTIVRGATHVQYVYGWGYAYTTNGSVTALQD